MFGLYSFDGNSKYERDPQLLKLEHDVFSQLSEITQKVEPNFKQTNKEGIRIVSFEEALKELLELKSKN